MHKQIKYCHFEKSYKSKTLYCIKHNFIFGKLDFFGSTRLEYKTVHTFGAHLSFLNITRRHTTVDQFEIRSDFHGLSPADRY